MTTTEAAAIANKTPTTIRNWIARGRLTAGTKTLEHAPWCVWDITEEALAAAEQDDLSVMQRLLVVLAKPFDHSQNAPDYATPAPQGSGVYQTFCGT